MLIAFALPPISFLILGIMFNVIAINCNGDLCGLSGVFMFILGYFPAILMALLYPLVLCTFKYKNRILEIKRTSSSCTSCFLPCDSIERIHHKYP